MRITSEKVEVNLETFDAETGERVGTIKGSKEIVRRNYNIKRLNVKIWQEAMDWVYLQVATSRTNTMVFNHIKNSVDSNNEIRTNMTHLASEIGVDPSTIRKMVKKLVDIRFLHRVDRGVYLVNPFVIKAKGQSNRTTEDIQAMWTSIYGTTPTEKSIQENKHL